MNDLKKAIVFLLFSLMMNAQNKKIEVSIQPDSIKNEYKESVTDLIQFKIDVNTDVKDLLFQNPAPFRDFEVLPNQSSNIRFSVNYKFIGFSYAVSPKFILGNNDNDEKGDTKSLGLALNLSFKGFQQRFTYNKVTGYYLQNTNDYRDLLPNPDIKYALLPDFKTLQIGSETLYYLNHKKYSYKLARDQSELQKESAGSWVLPLLSYYSSVDGTQQDFGFLDSFSKNGYHYPIKTNDFYVSTGLGYAQNFIWKNWYLSGLFVPTIGTQISKLTLSNHSSAKDTNYTVGLMSEMSAGYNSREWFGGVFSNFTTWTSPAANSQLTGRNLYVQFFVGYRIPAPKIVQGWTKKKGL